MSLSDLDLRTLRKLPGLLKGMEDRIAQRMERQYLEEFGDLAYHSTDTFLSEALVEIRLILDHLDAEDPGGLGAWLRAQGRRLFELGVPFAEICRSMRLFETAIVDTIRELGLPGEETAPLDAALRRLGSERLLLLAESFHSTCSLRWHERQDSLISTVARRESEQGRRDRMGGLIGRSEPMQRVFEQVQLAAASRDAVLLLGATGTGKELVARTIHAISGDPADRFVAVNCAAISHDLIESELFGHRRGAFSGAHRDHQGLFRAAHGGTLFLDEVTELSSGAQAKLLRALQERAVRPVGGISEIPVSVRIIASSNRELAAPLRDGGLRRDFYYRLRQLVIALPPLRDRLEDIPLLVRHFAERAAKDDLCSAGTGFTPEAYARLTSHSWPGNVRELESVIRNVCRRVGGRIVNVDDIILDPEPPAPQQQPQPQPLPEPPPPTTSPVSIRDAEREAIARALTATGGNKTRAAVLLGISRKQLYVKLRAYEL